MGDVNPDIPREEIERLQPVVDAVLAELRQRTGRLTPQDVMSLTYDLDPRLPEVEADR